MIKLHPKIIALLKRRGIETEEELDEFLSVRPQKTHDPFLLHNMEAGVDLILSAIDRGEKICIYGDYDADGITSTVIMTEILSQLTDQLSYYIPSRFDEGYGLNREAIQKIYDAGIRCLITVDCGSVSIEEVEFAKSLGMDVLVTDHHRVTDRKADCILINPNQPDCSYPNPNLAGCGVAFKFGQALTEAVGLSKHVLNLTLDLVGIGTIADVVPLVGENRTLVKYGLRTINARTRKNLDLLIRKTGLIPGQITSENVAFGIAPNLNAAGRIRHAGIGAELFLSKDPKKAERLADLMIRMNQDRKVIQNQIYEECLEQIQSEYPDDDFLVLEPKRAHEGINGIVAGKIREQEERPTILLTAKEDGTSKGTARSMPGVDLYALLKKEENLFTQFGGHAQACGFTIPTENTGLLREHLNASYRAILKEHPELRHPAPKAEMVLDENDVTVDFCDQLKLLAPFGQGNEKPVALVSACPEYISRIGQKGQYLRFSANLGNERLSCVAFRHADELERRLSEGGTRNILGYLSVNEWKGRKSPQMEVIDVQSEGEQQK